MKITNLEKGESYQLPINARLSVERTNPFFNNYGEQTVPLDLPASDHNRRLLDFPDSLGVHKKMAVTDACIQDGEYYAQCRQFVLSATRKGTISTSFYINDGSFYSRIQKVKLKDIFKDEFVPEVTSIASGIEFCRKLRKGNDPRFAIFPVLVNDDSGIGTGFAHKIINAFGQSYQFDVKVGDGTRKLNLFVPDFIGEDSDFYNAVQRTEYVNEIPITLAPGYYISPFIRTNYVLERIFAHFGYTLEENFFSRTEPFRSMVLLNNVIDVLANGRLKVADLLPDVTCTDFLSVFRKKFCCEFTSNEGTRTANVIFLHEALASPPMADLTHSMTAEPSIAYKSAKDYKRVVLSSKHTVEGETKDSYDDLDDLFKANPAAYLDPATGGFYKEGFSGDFRVITKIGEASQRYNTGEETEVNEIEVPDCLPEFRTLYYVYKEDGNEYKFPFGQWLYIGKYDTLNSKMEVAGEDKQETTKNANKLLPMLAFAYLSGKGQKPAGTISAYDLQASPHPRIFDYALYYNGDDGIFEKFYRQYDTLSRNALQEMKVKLLLSQSQKQNLPAHAKVVIRGTPFFLNKLKFTLGGKNDPVESELRTITLSTPVVSAPSISKMLPMMEARFRWVGKIRQTEVGRDEYNNSGLDRDRTFRTIYPPVPSAAWAAKTNAGIPYMLQTSFTATQTQHATFFRHSKWKFTKTEVWLECIPL